MTVPPHDLPTRKEGVTGHPVLPKIMPTPPDGGWGWMVVFASFMIHVLADGFTYSFGIYFVELVAYFKASSSATAGIVSILVGVTLGSGPVAGMLVNKFGCRWVTIAGAFLASFSLFVSIWAPGVAALYVTIGIGAGLGFGLIYLPAIVCVTGYFEKRRSFATGIAVCGSGIGTFIFSPFVEYLIVEYSWKGSMIILSGIMLNCVFLGALFRPLEDNPVSRHPSILYQEEGDADEEEYYVDQKEVLPLSDMPIIKIPKEMDMDNNMKKMGKDMKKNFSDANLQQHHLNPLIQNLRVTRMAVSQPLFPEVQGDKFDDMHASKSGSGSLPPSRHGSGLLYRKDIFYSGSLLNIPEYKQDPMSYRASMVRVPDMDETDSERESSKVCGCVPCSRETRDALGSLMDWSLLSDGIFILFTLSNFCTSIGFNAPYVFIMDRGLQLGMTSTQSSFLISVIGIANTISRIVLGYISDQPWVNRLYLYNISLTLCGISTVCSIWFTSYGSQCFYAAVFGATSGAYVGLTSVVLVDLLGMEKLTNAFGLLLLFQGIASLIGPPICGALFDMTQSYNYSFILAGSMIAISGLMLFFIPCIWKAQAKKLAEENSAPHYYASNTL